MTLAWKLFTLFIFYSQFVSGIGLSLRNVSIPNYGVKGGSALLSCEFNVLPSDKLVFLKWYKDDEEFFRFTPSLLQPILTFPLEGVFVELSRSNFNQLILTDLTLSSSGIYKCEAMAEGTFQAPSGTGPMTIIAPPEFLPVIIGVQPLVNIGDRVVGNCTSYRSKPATDLTFYVNGIALEQTETTESQLIIEPNGLETSVLAFNFVTEEHHFRGGSMELKCTATILNLYWIRTINVSQANINAQLSYTGQSRFPSSGSAPRISKILVLSSLLRILTFIECF